MGIKIKSASLSKGYSYGEYLQHKPGLECDITGETTEDEALDMLEQLLDKWHHKKMLSIFSPEPNTTVREPAIIPTIDKSIERLEIAIDNAKTIEELHICQEEAMKTAHGIKVYMNKLKKLSNGTK